MMLWQITNQELRYAELIAAGERAEAEIIVALDLDAADLQPKLQQLIDDGARAEADLIVALDLDEKRFLRIDDAELLVRSAIDRSSRKAGRQNARCEFGLSLRSRSSRHRERAALTTR